MSEVGKGRVPEVTVPGDKSITQRALIFAALAEGRSRLSGLLPGADPRAAAGALRALGARVPPLPSDGSEIVVEGVGLTGLRSPEEALDCMNSGTAARLLLGVLAGSGVEAVVTGDESLRSRPMRRVTDPLARMGARFEFLERPDRLPVRVRGGSLSPMEHRIPVASAQVKSAILLAGLVGGVEVAVVEPERSRDHTERLLRAVGCRVQEGGETDADEGSSEQGPWRVALIEPPQRIDPLDLRVPGDVSSAAFPIVFALLGGAGPELILPNVGLNPTRTGLLPVLGAMGAAIDLDVGEAGEELVGTIVVRPARLRGVVVGETGAAATPPLATWIDEVPILAVAAARAEGVTRIRGAGELRVKETDRIAALAANLRAIGVAVEELDDGLEIEGSDRPLRGRVSSFGDHRIAMAFGVLGALPENEIEVEGREAVEVSWPDFWEVIRELRGRRAPKSGSGETSPRAPVITIDGPAGSGKSTTAREVARRLGLPHLDSGALYRALTYALLRETRDPATWSELTRDELDRVQLGVRPGAVDFEVALDGRVLGDELRSEEVTRRVSRAAELPAVRNRLLRLQREAAERVGLVADGRDMGTVVFPDADLKVFLTAELEERARRRFLEREGEEPGAAELAREARQIQERDRIDSERAVAPLRAAEDAFVLDTTGLDFDEQVEAVIEAYQRATPIVTSPVGRVRKP